MLIDGVILAGGKSSRMGCNKSQIQFKGKPLINHVYDLLFPQVRQVWISTNEHLEQFPQDIQFQDEFSESFGPLTGIYSGLNKAESDWVQFCPNDSPFLDANLVRYLTQFINDESLDIVIPSVNNFLQPTFILCSKSLANEIPDFVNKEGAKLLKWVMAHNYVTVEFADKKAFTNINDKDALALIEND